MTFALSGFHTDDSTSLAAARHIREVVFCHEQGVSAADEWDGKDGLCEHFLLTADDHPIGCARVRPYGPGIFKIERVAVLKAHRGHGAGKFIMRALLLRLGGGTVILNAQLAVEGFYTRLGFSVEGEVFEEAGIAHVHMALRPTPASP